MKYEIRPVAPEFEPILGIKDDYCGGGYGTEETDFYAAMLAGHINVLGRPGLGQMFVSTRWGEPSSFESYGELELIRPSKFQEAGFHGIDFIRSTLEKVTDFGDDEREPAGWQYIQLVVPTAELFALYRSGDRGTDSYVPPPIRLSSPATVDLSVSLPEPKVLPIVAVAERIAKRAAAKEALINMAAVCCLAAEK